MKWLARLEALSQNQKGPGSALPELPEVPESISGSSGSALLGHISNSEPTSGSLGSDRPVVSANLDYDPFADLPPNDPVHRRAWQRWFSLLSSHWLEMGQGDRTPEEAHALVYSKAQCLWHERYGQRPDPHSCGGCGKPIDRSVLFVLPDGARVHDDADLRCLIVYAEKWRRAAADALRKLSIQ